MPSKTATRRATQKLLRFRSRETWGVAFFALCSSQFERRSQTCGTKGNRTKGGQMSKEYLRRYADIPALIYTLKMKCITLLDPQSWDDKNDSRYLTFCQEKNNFRTVLALCFAQSSETYHHWHVFAHGKGGVCI